jgi:hypothetical protein
MGLLAAFLFLCGVWAISGFGGPAKPQRLDPDIWDADPAKAEADYRKAIELWRRS